MDKGSLLEELRKKHDRLSKKVETAQRNPGGDNLESSEMKKRKLKIKEKIQRLEDA